MDTVCPQDVVPVRSDIPAIATLAHAVQDQRYQRAGIESVGSRNVLGVMLLPFASVENMTDLRFALRGWLSGTMASFTVTAGTPLRVQ